jgi:hypothetical protein
MSDAQLTAEHGMLLVDRHVSSGELHARQAVGEEIPVCLLAGSSCAK